VPAPTPAARRHRVLLAFAGEFRIQGTPADLRASFRLKAEAGSRIRIEKDGATLSHCPPVEVILLALAAGNN
jgi:hypothetical protein